MDSKNKLVSAHEIVDKGKGTILFDEVIQIQEDLFHSLTPLNPSSIADFASFYEKDDLSSYEAKLEIDIKETVRIHYPLHLAARDGDCDKIIELVNDGFGYNVNQKDARSVTPLHVAALFGQLDAVKTLISLGATVDAKGYENHTPLHFALAKQHYDVAKSLIVDYQANLKLEDYKGTNGFSLLFDPIPEMFKNKNKNIEQVIELVEIAIRNTKGPLYYNDISEFKDELYLTPVPVPVVLSWIASDATTLALADRFIYLIQEAQAKDPSSQAFCNAKDLFNRFPTSEIYRIKISEKKSIWFRTEGHSGIFTTDLATESLQAFTKLNAFENSDPLKAEIFSALEDIYNNATMFTQYANTREAAEGALALFNEGKTVLLPSGWDGHFIDVILSKTQLLYIVANSGERYHGESPDYTPDPAGINFYQMYEPEKISAAFMNKVLNNTDKTFLEFENAYEYGVFERIEEISKQDQQFGNCSWESHRDAVEGLIYIELLNRDINPVDAKSMATEYYQEWDDFHGNFVIDRYLASEPILPFEALIDIFNQLHTKTDFNQVDHVHAQKIAEALVSPHYIEDFQSWMKDKGVMDEDQDSLADKLTLNILHQSHGIDVACVFKAGSMCQSHQPEELQEISVQPDILIIEPSLLMSIPLVQTEIF